MVALAYPPPEELTQLMDRAFKAHEEIHRIVRGIVRLHQPAGPAFITGSLQLKLHITMEAHLAYQALRRELYPTPSEVQFSEEASRAFVALEEAGISIAEWEYMGLYEGCCSWSFWEFTHMRRRDCAYSGPRAMHLLIPNN